MLARREGSHTADVQRRPPGFSEPVAVPGANPTVGVRGLGVREGTRDRLSHPTPSQRTLAPSRPQLGHQLPGTVRLVFTLAAVGRRVFEGTDRSWPGRGGRE